MLGATAWFMWPTKSLKSGDELADNVLADVVDDAELLGEVKYH